GLPPARRRQPRGDGADLDPRGGEGRHDRGADAGGDEKDQGRARDQTWGDPAPARRGRPEGQRQGPRRHPLPAGDRGPQRTERGAGEGRRRAGRGAERARPARRAAAQGGGLVATYRRQVTNVKATFDDEQGVFMISVAAELAEMHPQTLRIYETRGLITPKRSPKNTRLYSRRDVERLRRIQEMTQQGLNLVGVETVLALEEQVQKLKERVRELEGRKEL